MNIVEIASQSFELILIFHFAGCIRGVFFVNLNIRPKDGQKATKEHETYSEPNNSLTGVTFAGLFLLKNPPSSHQHNRTQADYTVVQSFQDKIEFPF